MSIINRNVVAVNYNWSYNYSIGEEYKRYEIGKKDVVKITEYFAEDKQPYHITVNFKDGTSTKIFNINQIFYKEEEK